MTKQDNPLFKMLHTGLTVAQIKQKGYKAGQIQQTRRSKGYEAYRRSHINPSPDYDFWSACDFPEEFLDRLPFQACLLYTSPSPRDS